MLMSSLSGLVPLGAAGRGRSLGLRALWEPWVGGRISCAGNNRMDLFHKVSKYVCDTGSDNMEQMNGANGSCVKTVEEVLWLLLVLKKLSV